MRIIVLLAVTLSLAACSSGNVIITKTPQENYQRLGKTEGTGCGTMGVISTAYNFLPIFLNDRYERAYAEALGKIPGATGLIDVTLEETWFWWVVGTTRCSTVAGEAIK
jgi:hypothetical protein